MNFRLMSGSFIKEMENNRPSGFLNISIIPDKRESRWKCSTLLLKERLENLIFFCGYEQIYFSTTDPWFNKAGTLSGFWLSCLFYMCCSNASLFNGSSFWNMPHLFVQQWFYKKHLRHIVLKWEGNRDSHALNKAAMSRSLPSGSEATQIQDQQFPIINCKNEPYLV